MINQTHSEGQVTFWEGLNMCQSCQFQWGQVFGTSGDCSKDSCCEIIVVSLSNFVAMFPSFTLGSAWLWWVAQRPCKEDKKWLKLSKAQTFLMQSCVKVYEILMFCLFAKRPQCCDVAKLTCQFAGNNQNMSTIKHCNFTVLSGITL